MKKRIVNKYFSQIKKGRKNVRLKRKVGRKGMIYLYKHRKDIFPNDVWGQLLKMWFDSKGVFGIFTVKENSYDSRRLV